MKTLTQAELDAFLEKAGIVAAGPERGIGRELRYHPPTRRTIVIHFGPADSTVYVSAIVSILLSSATSWVVVARYGPAARLGDFTIQPDAQALGFDASERERLCAYLCTRDMALGAVSQDLYLLADDGHLLVTWDHHTADEGLCVDVRDVHQSSALLSELNTFGAELEVFYTERTG